jgi:pimeloyl-ACP methyl ester carboxylesterase
MQPAGATRTIVLIHGNFVTRHSWDRWVARYEDRGYTVVTPAYPLRDKSVAALRQNPRDPALGRLALPEVIDHHVRVLRDLNEKPIIIGHSFGGLLTQLMLQRDLGVAGVAIDSVPPQNILPLHWSLIRSIWPIVNPLVPVSRPYFMPFSDFQYSFGNDLPEAEQRAGWEADIVPESRRLSRGGLSSAAKVDFARKRPPLLLIAGEKDHIMPAALNRTNYERYAKSPSATEFRQFPGRAHYSIIAGKGWEEVADYALEWAVRMANSVSTAASTRAIA